MKRFLSAVLASLWSLPAAAACGPDAGHCSLPSGQYHLALPEEAEGAPAVMFLHGAGSRGANVMRNETLVDSLLSRGYAVLAPTGSRSFGNGQGRSWNFYPGWEGRNETQFLQDVVNDAATRFGLNSNRILLSGFSAGGFMVNYLACSTPDRFAAYAPVAGGFWQPRPDTCEGPVKLLHTHGWMDKTVPLEGRSLGGGRFQQGDIFEGLRLWRDANACADQRPGVITDSGPYWRRVWTDCTDGSALELAVFAGGHTVPSDWGGMALDWFEAQTAPDHSAGEAD